MLGVERQTIITDMISKQRLVKVADLTHLFSVSEMTIRRDLDVLEKRGVLKKVYGGAVAEPSTYDDPQDIPYHIRSTTQIKEKIAIAQGSIDFIKPNDVIFLDAGTTTLEIARLIHHRSDVVVITNSILVANELSGSSVTLIIIGGQVRGSTHSVVGAKAIGFISDLVVSTCFVAASGLSLDKGIMNSNMDESELKRNMMCRSEKAILVADTSKFDSPSSYHVFAGWSEIDTFITDGHLSTWDQKKLEQHGLYVITVPVMK